VAVPKESGPLNAPLTRVLVEVWWETRERRWARPVLRGRVTRLPDGRPRAFSDSRQLTALVMAASGRPRATRGG
jgi:hypothetical protein